MKGIRLVPEETNFNFIGLRFLAYALSAALVLGSIGLAVQRGLNFGIDFTGGTVIEVRTPEMPDLAELRALLNDLDLGAITLQEFGSPEDLLIRLPEQKGGIEVQQMAIEDVREALNDIYADAGEVDYRRTEFVGPQVGSELKKQGLMAVLFSLAGILAYVWFRFEWHLLKLAQILANTVKHNHRVIDRIPRNHQNRRHGRQIKFHLRERK